MRSTPLTIQNNIKALNAFIELSKRGQLTNKQASIICTTIGVSNSLINDAAKAGLFTIGNDDIYTANIRHATIEHYQLLSRTRQVYFKSLKDKKKKSEPIPAKQLKLQPKKGVKINLTQKSISILWGLLTIKY